MKKYSRAIKLSLFVGLTILLAITLTLWRARSIQRQEHQAIKALSTVSYIGKFDTPVMFSMGPNVAAYYRWKGPSWLEKPMRSLGIPWFDRITEVLILYDSEISESDFVGLDQLGYLSDIEVESPKRNFAFYESLVTKFDHKVQLRVTRHGSNQ